jgi:hypothetical protein
MNQRLSTSPTATTESSPSRVMARMFVRIRTVYPVRRPEEYADERMMRAVFFALGMMASSRRLLANRTTGLRGLSLCLGGARHISP